jgi:aminomethyltransferase
MSSTSLIQKFGMQAVAGEYAGAETVLNFGSAAEELEALRHGCGVFDLGWRGKLVVSGEDRVRWLNGMVSNNTRDLRQDFGNYNFVLSPQGRIQGDLLAFQRGEFYVLETEASQVGAIREFFERYIIMDDVEIGDISAGLTSIGIGGPRALDVLSSMLQNLSQIVPQSISQSLSQSPELKVKAGQLLDGSWNGMGYSLVRDPVEARNWYELWLAPENVEAFWGALVAAGATAVGAEALEWQRILLGLPRMGMDMGGRELPQETGQEYALHHSKGCYIGQEIVERIHARGQVHRRLTGLIVEGAAPARGSKVVDEEKEIGEITSSAAMLIDGVARTVALGYLRREGAGKTVQSEKAQEALCVVGSAGGSAGGSAARIAAFPIEF